MKSMLRSPRIIILFPLLFKLLIIESRVLINILILLRSSTYTYLLTYGAELFLSSCQLSSPSRTLTLLEASSLWLTCEQPDVDILQFALSVLEMNQVQSFPFRFPGFLQSHVQRSLYNIME
jgi:hypothetical protein